MSYCCPSCDVFIQRYVNERAELEMEESLRSNTLLDIEAPPLRRRKQKKYSLGTRRDRRKRNKKSKERRYDEWELTLPDEQDEHEEENDKEFDTNIPDSREGLRDSLFERIERLSSKKWMLEDKMENIRSQIEDIITTINQIREQLHRTNLTNKGIHIRLMKRKQERILRGLIDA